MKYIIFLFGIISPLIVSAQNSITINECYTLARQNYPLLKNKDLLRELETEKLSLISKDYLPKLNANLIASYQSDVTSLNATAGTGSPVSSLLPALSKDHYQMNLDIQQLIWDGGLNKEEQSLQKLNSKWEIEKLEVKLYEINKHINQLFYSILLIDKQINVLKLSQENVISVMNELKTEVDQGMALKSELDFLKVETIAIQQKITELNYSQRANIKMLSIYIGKELSPEFKFKIANDLGIGDELNNIRPELKAFDLQKEWVSANKNLIKVSRMPFIMANGQIGYGRPALNMLSNKFDTYYKIGLSLRWNLYDWNKNKNKKNILDIQSNIIDKEKQTFEHNINIQQQVYVHQILKFQDLIKQDRQIIELRNSIVEVSKSKLNNGTITSSDYINELNKKTQSQLNIEFHKIQLSLAKQSLMNLLGYN